MCFMLNGVNMIRMNKTGSGRLATLLGLAFIVAGCTNNMPVKKVAVVEKPQPPRQKVVVVKPQPQPQSQPQAVRQSKSGPSKDEHHIAYDKKRMWYNQQWLVKQEQEERLRQQRVKYQRIYEEKQREQAKLRQQREAQARWEQQQRQQRQQQPAVTTMASRAGQLIQNQHRQRQAQIEAQQQQYNWRKDGGWQRQQQLAQARQQQQQQQRQRYHQQWQHQQRMRKAVRTRPAHSGVNLASQLSNAAIALTYRKIRYDGSYIPISYPMGDVPSNIGACTDTLIRSYRRLGIDLQQLVHEDISRAFNAYPNLPKWGLSGPDTNIDHRRVHNLKVFFSRHGRRLPVTNNPADYRPGDIVTWHLHGDQEHIGLVVNRRSPEDPRRHMIVHNIAKGDRMEDVLFRMPITGHYRYLPNRSRWLASR